MDAIHTEVPFVDMTIAELHRLGVTKAFVMANRSSAIACQPLLDVLSERGLLAGPICCDIGMGGGEEGLLSACDAAAALGADGVVTIGSGAVQDAGKLIRLWLSAVEETSDGGISVEKIIAASKRTPMPGLPPQISVPNSFAMAELTPVAGITTKDKVKSGASHPSMMPTVVIFDPSLSKGLPEWLRYGTALRGVEHSVGALCSPTAEEAHRELALHGLEMAYHGLIEMVRDADSKAAQVNAYKGGWYTIQALTMAGYPALGHFVENHYSARFDVHQGSCSGILCARILAYHADVTQMHQSRISEVLGQPDVSASSLITGLVSRLPGVAKDHHDVGVTQEQLVGLAVFLYAQHRKTLNRISPKQFEDEGAVLRMLTRPLTDL